MFTHLFGEHPEARILEFLARHREFDYTITEISRNSGVSRPAAYKVLARFLERGVALRTRRVGGSYFFRLNEENDLVKPFLDLDLEIKPEEPKRRRLPSRNAREGAR